MNININKRKDIIKNKNYKNHKNRINIIKILLILTYIIFFQNNINADETIYNETKTEDNIINSVSSSYEFDEYINTLNGYAKNMEIEGIDLGDISKSLISNKGVEYNSIIAKLIGIFSKEFMIALKGAVIIYIIVIIMAIISNFELEKKSDITKISHLVCFLALSTVVINTFVDTIAVFKNVVGVLTTIMQVISPFLMAILISTGAITSTGIIQPLLLFLASAIGFIVNYIVIPFFTISVAFNIICSISENLRLEKISKLFTSSALWITIVALTIFIGVLSIETSISSSVDSLTVKTTQAAVSNFVPVVGKFFSDSFESVVGATQIIGKVGGTLGIICIILVASIPIIKIASVMCVYMILAALIQPICTDDDIVKYISRFANIYKTLLGILIGILILFVISTGIVLNLSSSIVT